MNAFLSAFASETGLNQAEANEQWSGYSRQLSDSQLKRIERGGKRSGRQMGCAFMRDHPDDNDESDNLC